MKQVKLRRQNKQTSTPGSNKRSDIYNLYISDGRTEVIYRGRFLLKTFWLKIWWKAWQSNLIVPPLPLFQLIGPWKIGLLGAEQHSSFLCLSSSCASATNVNSITPTFFYLYLCLTLLILTSCFLHRWYPSSVAKLLKPVLC